MKRFMLVCVMGMAGVCSALWAQADENYDFRGVIRLPLCSASLVQLEGSKDDTPGLVLTNGHCTGQIDPGAFVYHKHLRRALPMSFLGPDGELAGRTVSYDIVYATMTGTDIAFYQLAQSYAEIRSRFGISPLTLASRHPSVGEPIEILSGYLKKGFSCGIETFVTWLKEDQWTDADSMRYSRPGCEVTGGSSGSPVLEAGTRTVVGINNTANENGEACTMDNPCEVDSNGKITYAKGYAYGQEVNQVYSCLNASGEIDLSVPGCLLTH